MSTFFESWILVLNISLIFENLLLFYTYIWSSQCNWKTSGSFWTKKRKQTSQLSRFHCLSHGLAVGSSFLTGFQILSGFFPKLAVFWKKLTNKHRQNIPMLLKNAFLEWLTKTNKQSQFSIFELETIVH